MKLIANISFWDKENPEILHNKGDIFEVKNKDRIDYLLKTNIAGPYGPETEPKKTTVKTTKK